MSTFSTEQRRIALIEQIHLAFAGVGRGCGISLHEAMVIDNYGSEEERDAARNLDAEHRWQHVPEADIEQCDAALSYLDPLGFRYYLPAYMVWVLNHYHNSNANSVNFTIYALAPGFLLRSLRTEQFSRLNQEQSEAVGEFLRFMADEPTGMVDVVAARRALKHWGRVRREAD